MINSSLESQDEHLGDPEDHDGSDKEADDGHGDHEHADNVEAAIWLPTVASSPFIGRVSQQEVLSVIHTCLRKVTNVLEITHFHTTSALNHCNVHTTFQPSRSLRTPMRS